MQELIYERPTAIAEVVDLARRDGARLLAGGTDLVPQLREGRRAASRIVDLKHVPELTRIERTSSGGWRIGGATSVRTLGAHSEFAREHHGLVASARLIGSVQVQSRASLGGNLCNAAPSADGVPLLIALDAEAEIAGPGGSRRVPVSEIAIGPGRTSLVQGEIVAALALPPRAPRSASHYLRFTPRREMDIAVAGSGVAITLDDTRRISHARIVLASVGPAPIRAVEAEALLMGEIPSKAVFAAAGVAAARQSKPISDTRGSADYRRELVAVLTRRALAAAVQELGITLA